MNTKYYKGFCYLTNIIARTLIACICSLVIYGITGFLVPYWICFGLFSAIYIATNGLSYIISEELPLSDLGDWIFKYIYKLKPENYIYSVEEVVHNDNTKEYYPIVTTIKHYYPSYINVSGGKYYIDRFRPISFGSYENSLIAINEYKKQEDYRRRKEHLRSVKEVNLLTFNFEK